ncbi:MAG: hypothetical protein COA79_10990 [Planctomycetota bacterium]|nr:MAG: hypothetical protein COA79_10990 [Planctomycetota bacterium]
MLKRIIQEIITIYLPLIGIFIFAIYGPDFFSKIIFGENIGNVSYLKYIGKDIDLVLRKDEMFDIDSIWYIVPMESLFLWIHEFLLLGLFFIISIWLLFRWYIIEGHLTLKNAGLNLDTIKYDLFISFIVILFFGILLMSIECVHFLISKQDFIKEYVMYSSDSEDPLLMKHPVYFCCVLLLKCFVGPIFEEFFFRGILYARTRQYINKAYISITISILFNSIIFASLHYLIVEISFENLLLPLICGIFSCIIFEKSKSLIPSIVFHCAGNSFIFCTVLFYI